MKVYIDKLQAQIAETDKKLYETNFDLTKAQEVLTIKIECLRVTSVTRTLCCCGVFFEGAIFTQWGPTTIYDQFAALTLCLTDHMAFCVNLLGSSEHKDSLITNLTVWIKPFWFDIIS